MENTSALPSPFSFNCCGPKTFASQLGAPGYLYSIPSHPPKRATNEYRAFYIHERSHTDT